MPQPPQLKGSLLRSTHPPPQSVRPAAAQACRAGAAPARPGSQPVTVPMARRRSTWRREAPAATARATASKLELSTESSSYTERGRGLMSRSRLRGSPSPTQPRPHRMVSRPGPRYSRRARVSRDAAHSRGSQVGASRGELMRRPTPVNSYRHSCSGSRGESGIPRHRANSPRLPSPLVPLRSCSPCPGLGPHPTSHSTRCWGGLAQVQPYTAIGMHHGRPITGWARALPVPARLSPPLIPTVFAPGRRR